MPLVTIEDPRPLDQDQCREYCRRLEMGEILYFPASPVRPPQEDVDFLLQQHQSGVHYHKNIAYRPGQEKVTGLTGASAPERRRLLEIMRGYAHRTRDFLARLLPRYADQWRLEYGSFRPQEEAGRDLRRRARNDLLHVDSFPTRPTGGDRILRFFTNLNPDDPRRWIVGEPFERLVPRFAGKALPTPGQLESSLGWRLGHSLGCAARALGLPVAARPAYDEFMLRFHHFLKENEEFQHHSPREEFDFPPGSSWMVFTDLVPHAVLSGRYALEQTFLVPTGAMLDPEKAPVRVLERLD